MPNDVHVDVTDRLLALYDTNEASFRTSLEVVAVIAHGWYTRVRRGIQATRKLEKAGFGHEAAPLRRSLIEHTAQLQWLAQVQDRLALDALADAYQRTVRKIREAVDGRWQVAANVDWEAILGVSVPKSSESVHLKARQLFEKYAPDFYPPWLAESGYSHPSLASATVYSSWGSDGPHLSHVPQLDHAGEPALAALLLLATDAFNTLLMDEPWTDTITSCRDLLMGWSRGKPDLGHDL